VHRRDILRAAGVAAVFTILPRQAAASWARLLRSDRATHPLSPAQLRLVTAIGDAIIPRTDTPGASDVGVPQWIELVVSEHMSAEHRAAFVAGLASIDDLSRRISGGAFADLSPAVRGKVMASLDPPENRLQRLLARKPDIAYYVQTATSRVERLFHWGSARNAYTELKALVVQGYFTSEPVWTGVLHTRVMPGSFIGDLAYAPPLTAHD